ncbi:MAG: zinc-binding protein [Deltaproteobacteria bacterium]|nr:zinc-binding protein [Deltaproteobacteria bacterium]
MNILELYQRDGHQGKREASTNGGTWGGHCPHCGGRDRFRIQPFFSGSNWHEGGRWSCNRCYPRWSDAPGYLMVFHRMTYPDACRELGIEPKRRQEFQAAPLAPRPAWKPEDAAPPPSTWQKKATDFVACGEKNLWSEAGAEAKAYLKSRGLSRNFIKFARLGWNPETQFDDYSVWGLPPERNEKGNPRKVWLAPGIVIPVFGGDGQLLRVKIRRSEPDSKPKYIAIAGGAATSFMVLGDAAAVVVVEAELDALLLYQEAGDLATMIATGSAQFKPSAEAFARLKKAPAVLVALDAEQSGYEAWKWWRDNLSNTRFCPVPVGKDPTEAHQKGIDLRAWVGACVL